ncbi:IS110 family RNA-guided transposase [Planctomicrobium piriforme]|uniref:Transposase n=1 Tax=Planctomicrobium piriforme TaxID=1576369 RepID=A0A1I3SFT4_9PLAN|nr:IS110 family transposase [Planctomicrobium piriforme]SFJ57585.1 Transposase [Planctomicrobium piriforme]
MVYVGVDLHKHTISLCVVNRERSVLERKRLHCCEEHRIVEFLKLLRKQQRGIQVVVEATASYEWFVKLVEPIAQKVILAHPKKLRVIAESTRKSDKLDAQVLAEFLALDMIPEAYRPTPRQREHRTLVRHRQRVQKGITSIKNTLRRILSHYNSDIKSLFTQEGLTYLREVALCQADRFVVDQLCLQLTHQQELLRAVDRELSAFAKAGSEQETANRELLRSIPGVGRVTSDVVVSELGDMQRFANARKVAAYAGLAPGQRESAGKRKDLHIEKCGSRLLRATLVEAAWQLVKRSPRWRDIFERLRARTGQKKKAIVAIARRLLTVMYALLKRREPFRPFAVA